MLIDTHAHLSDQETIKRALDNDVWVILVGTEFDDSKLAVKSAEKYQKGVYAAVGLHPSNIEKQKEFNIEKYQKLAKNKKVVAIGEIGLDYYNLDKKNQEEIKYKQKQIFLEQVDFARQIDKPIIIHCREAYNDLFDLLSVFTSGCSHCPNSCSQLRGVVHCFSGDIEIANKFLNMGFYISFTGIITFSQDYDDVIKEVSLDKILIETDSPYLTPVPYRGKKNEPIYVKQVAEKIAELKEIDFNKIAEQTTQNAKELFGI